MKVCWTAALDLAQIRGNERSARNPIIGADGCADAVMKTIKRSKQMRSREIFRLRSSLSDFGTTTEYASDIIFLLTSFFNDSIHQLVATKDRCKISMNNGRENRTNGNEEEGEKEKEALRGFSLKSKRGTLIASPKFLCGTFLVDLQIASGESTLLQKD
jgi:hypothetical protein